MGRRAVQRGRNSGGIGFTRTWLLVSRLAFVRGSTRGAWILAFARMTKRGRPAASAMAGDKPERYIFLLALRGVSSRFGTARMGRDALDVDGPVYSGLEART